MKKSVIILAIVTIMLLQASKIFAQNAAASGGTFEQKQTVAANDGEPADVNFTANSQP